MHTVLDDSRSPYAGNRSSVSKYKQTKSQFFLRKAVLESNFIFFCFFFFELYVKPLNVEGVEG